MAEEKKVEEAVEEAVEEQPKKKAAKKVDLVAEIEAAKSLEAVKEVIADYRKKGKVDKAVENAIYRKTIEIVGA